MLLVVSMLCAGCGNANETKETNEQTAVEKSNKETVEDSSGSDSSNRDTSEAKKSNKKKEQKKHKEGSSVADNNKSAGVNKNEVSAGTVYPGDTDGLDLHFISIHDNADPVDSGSYFSDQEAVTSRVDTVTRYFHEDKLTKYEYSCEPRVFDFLVETPDTNMSLPETNLKKVADVVKEEYAKDNGVKLEDLPTVSDRYIDDINAVYIIYFHENYTDPRSTPVGDYIIIFHSSEDPTNGVTVFTVEDCEYYDPALI